MKKLVIVLMITIISVVIFNNAYAHSGRTDRFGGHHNWKSGSGAYHFHGGY